MSNRRPRGRTQISSFRWNPRICPEFTFLGYVFRMSEFRRANSVPEFGLPGNSPLCRVQQSMPKMVFRPSSGSTAFGHRCGASYVVEIPWNVVTSRARPYISLGLSI